MFKRDSEVPEDSQAAAVRGVRCSWTASSASGPALYTLLGLKPSTAGDIGSRYTVVYY